MIQYLKVQNKQVYLSAAQITYCFNLDVNTISINVYHYIYYSIFLYFIVLYHDLFQINSMFDPLQSVYRDKLSTETDLFKVENDILSALDAGSSASLLLLYLSAVFDTIDHDILLSRLCNVYGITGNTLDWFRSYLTGRRHRVVIEDSVSVDQELGFRVPQDSVLGPKIYCMYTKPVSAISQRHGLSHNSYTDNTHLYMTMDHSNNNWRDSLARIELCVSEIREWINQNMLKLNVDKTELIVFTYKYKQHLYDDLNITIGGTVVDCSFIQHIYVWYAIV